MDSDSDDDMSLSASEGEDDVDMEAEDDGDGAAEDTHVSDGEELDMDAGSDAEHPNTKWFQKEFWQFKKLPYYPELEAQANQEFGEIKAGFAHSVLLNDPMYGLLHWTLELERYIDHYGRRFSKEDHILLVKILYPMVKKGSVYRDVKTAIHCLNALLCKRDFLVPGDIVLDWKPLHELYVEVSYKNLEEDGIFLLPENFKTDLHTLVFYARHFFPPGTTQELLDEFRPLMCLWDESVIRAYKLLDIFLPMNMLPNEQEADGCGLWLAEAWHWYTAIEQNSSIEPNLLKMFGRISFDCPGYVDWTDKLDIIFTKLVRSLRLGPIVGLCQTFNMDSGALWIAYMLGTPAHEKLITHLRNLFQLVESFIHPSNNGNHTQHLLNMIHKLLLSVVARLKRERAEKPDKPSTINKIPEWMKLNQSHLDELITMMLPCIKLAIFTKQRHDFIPPMLKNASSLAPKIVIPAVLDIVYPALDTLTEPHRLLQALQAFVSVTIPLCKDQPGPDGKTFRLHAITLMNLLLPGLDVNDMSKCMATFQAIGVLVNLIPLADSSDAIHLRSDLTDDEKELCSATANFENIIVMFMNKLLSMLIDRGETASSTSGGHGAINTKTKSNIEDSILHRGTISVFKGIVKNSSTALYKVAVDMMYDFACNNVFDSRVAADSLADMIHIAVRFYPDQSFVRFLTLIKKRLAACITAETYQEEKADFHVVWWLSMAARLLQVPSPHILANWEHVRWILDLVLPVFKCSLAAEKSNLILNSVLSSLCGLNIMEGIEKRKNLDLPTDEYFPIRFWAAPADKKTFQPLWHIPSQEGINRAVELFKEFVIPHLNVFKSREKVDKKELLHRLWSVRHAVNGASASLPFFEGENILLHDSPVFMATNHKICKPTGTPEVVIDGQNVRQMVLDSLKVLIDYLMNESEDDVKSINETVGIMGLLMNIRGISKETYAQSANHYRITKMILSEKLAGNKQNIQMLSEEYINLLHKKRMVGISGYQFKQGHLDILNLLVRIGTSTYSQNRVRAQTLLSLCLKSIPYSYKKIVDPLLHLIDPATNATHEQLKGALHMLVDGKKFAIVLRMSFSVQLKVWPAIVNAQHSEKISIIQVLDNAQNTIVDGYESYRLKFEVTEEMRKVAYKLLENKDGSPLNTKRGPPSDELIEKYKNNLEVTFEENKRDYYALADKLLKLAQDPNMHWRHVEMAQSMLSLLIRRDIPFPEQAIRHYVKLLVSDIMKTRKMASAVISSYLKMNKPKAVKRIMEVKNKPANNSPGAKWPINYGIREDNRMMMYEDSKLPQTAEDWNKFQFCGKQHWGFYTWPKELKTYAPLGEQTAIDRHEEDLTPTEKHLVDAMRDPEFALRFRTLSAVEEKKGEETFNAVHFALFQGLFRCFNDILCPTFKEHLEALIISPKESDQKLAAEMIAGMVNGSKLWKWERQQKMWAWLGSLLTRALETIKDDNMRNWGVAVATICGCSEPRLVKPLIDLLFALIDKPTENAFAASSRLFVVQGALIQFQWRAIELWNRLVKSFVPGLIHQYANLRDRVAICLVSASWFDVHGLRIADGISDQLRPPKVEDVVSLFEPYLYPCWDEARMIRSDMSRDASAANLEAMDAEFATSGDSEVKRTSRLALKTIISYTTNQTLQSYVALPQTIIRLLPLFCHYSNDVGDEELQKSCSNLTRDVLQSVLVQEEYASSVLTVFTQILHSSCWWKTKVTLLKMIKINVFSNIFVYAAHRESLGSLLLSSLSDPQIEVRETTADTLSGLLQSGFFPVTQQLVDTFCQRARDVSNVAVRHSGVLGLGAIIQAHPYSVPKFLPDVLMHICKYASSQQPIKDTVKKALSEFKRTHMDSWREHESLFNEDQLCVLRGLLISPNYYV